MFPFNTNAWARKARTDVASIVTAMKIAVTYALGSPAVSDDDALIATTNMIVGAYTLLTNTLDVARNIIVTTTDATGADTKGTLVVVGTDIAGKVLTETINIGAAAGVTAGVNAFKTVASVTGAGWVINGGNDQIKVGFGEVLGLPDKLSEDTVMHAVLNGTRESTRPTVTYSATVLAQNTVDLNSACGGTAVTVTYLV